MRSWPPSTDAMSEPRARPVSRTKRRSAADAESSDLRNSSSTQASGPRSLVARSRSFSVACIRLWLGLEGLHWRRPSGDLEPGHRLAQLFGHARELAHLLRSGARALAGLLGHRENVLDIARHHVG